jgi:hypothetical protein
VFDDNEYLDDDALLESYNRIKSLDASSAMYSHQAITHVFTPAEEAELKPAINYDRAIRGLNDRLTYINLTTHIELPSSVVTTLLINDII